ncbi:MAG TPA: hypothetical protein PLD80_01370 [Rugosibacter sp.]|nr:hypothetical protein [Rugosibacter sp.]HQN45586.1 hypothetical protein [Rugosibacter sp.]
MKTKNRIAMILCSSLLIASGVAQAGDRSGDVLLGGLIGGGAGAVIGNHVGGRNGAIIGGALGAATGVAITTDRGSRSYRGERYVAAPVYAPVRERYVAAPVYIQPRRVMYYEPEVRYVKRRGHDYDYRERREFHHGRSGHDHRSDNYDGGRRNYRGWD